MLRNIKAAHQGDPRHLWAPAWGNANLSDEVKDLLDRMLDVDTECRITIAEIMDHPWFKVNPLSLSLPPNFRIKRMDADAAPAISLFPHCQMRLDGDESFVRAQDITEEAQEKWNKVSDIMDQSKQDRLKKLVHEAMIDHGHPGEILEWHPPTSLRVRTIFSHQNLPTLLAEHAKHASYNHNNNPSPEL